MQITLAIVIIILASIFTACEYAIIRNNLNPFIYHPLLLVSTFVTAYTAYCIVVGLMNPNLPNTVFVVRDGRAYIEGVSKQDLVKIKKQLKDDAIYFFIKNPWYFPRPVDDVGFGEKLKVLRQQTDKDERVQQQILDWYGGKFHNVLLFNEKQLLSQSYQTNYHVGFQTTQEVIDQYAIYKEKYKIPDSIMKFFSLVEIDRNPNTNFAGTCILL